MVINKHSFCVCANKNPKNERGEEEGEKDGRKEGRARKKERGRERGKEKGRVERNASSMQETDIFNNEDDFLYIYLFLHSGIKGAETACEK